MKRKVTKVRGASDAKLRANGWATFRVSGPHPETGERVVKEFFGTREEAEELPLEQTPLTEQRRMRVLQGGLLSSCKTEEQVTARHFECMA